MSNETAFVEITPHDAWLLSYLQRLPPRFQDRAEGLISQLSSDMLKRVGHALVTNTPPDPSIEKIVASLRNWQVRNQTQRKRKLLQKRRLNATVPG